MSKKLRSYFLKHHPSFLSTRDVQEITEPLTKYLQKELGTHRRVNTKYSERTLHITVITFVLPLKYQIAL